MVGVFQLFGISFLLWTGVGLLRFLAEWILPRMRASLPVTRARQLLLPAPLPHRVFPDDVAVVMAAHNEELTIGATLSSILRQTKPQHVYVGSDGSTDSTVEKVRGHACHVLDIQPNGGKAKTLTRILEEYDILNRYKAVLFVDADLKMDEGFFRYALPQFDDEKVVAIVGHAVSLWPKHSLPRWRYFFTAYRIRLWRVLQFCLRYGQTWKYTNVTPIVPGGGSFYRTSALKNIRIHVPGMVIEDFNMTFNIHHKRLGRISFDPRAYVMDQEPFSLRDYIKQIHRWYVGFFQTIRHHGFWPSAFCFLTYGFTAELLVASVIFLLMPLFVAELLLTQSSALSLATPFATIEVTLIGIAIMLFAIDYIVTIIVAMIERKPLLLVYGAGFILLRYVEAAVFLLAMITVMFRRNLGDGQWKSPQRISYADTAGASNTS